MGLKQNGKWISWTVGCEDSGSRGKPRIMKKGCGKKNPEGASVDARYEVNYLGSFQGISTKNLITMRGGAVKC